MFVHFQVQSIKIPDVALCRNIELVTGDNILYTADSHSMHTLSSMTLQVTNNIVI